MSPWSKLKISSPHLFQFPRKKQTDLRLEQRTEVRCLVWGTLSLQRMDQSVGTQTESKDISTKWIVSTYICIMYSPAACTFCLIQWLLSLQDASSLSGLSGWILSRIYQPTEHPTLFNLPFLPSQSFLLNSNSYLVLVPVPLPR